MKKIFKALPVIAGFLSFGLITYGYFYLTDDYNELVNLDSDDAVLLKEDMTPYTGRLLPFLSGYSGKFVNGKKVGEHLIYSGWHILGLGGNLRAIQHFKDGKRTGNWKSWSWSGIESSCSYKDGRYSGPREYWNEFGELIHLNYNENDINEWIEGYLRDESDKLKIEGIYVVYFDDDTDIPYKFAVINYRSQIVAINMQDYEVSRSYGNIKQYHPGDVKFSLSKQGSKLKGTLFYTDDNHFVSRYESREIIEVNDSFFTWSDGWRWYKLIE